MKCSEVKANLSAYVNGELDPRQSAALEQHLGGCGGCARKWSYCNNWSGA